MSKIEVYTQTRENLPNVYFLQSVISYDKTGCELKNYQDLISGSEFHDLTEIRKYIANKLNIDGSIIEFPDNQFIDTPWD